MIVRRIASRCIVTVLLTLSAAFGLNNSIALQPGPRGAEDGVEILTRGPVHEAFAETVTFDPQPGHVVPKPAPQAIEELPPEQKPDGANVDWIPGYWAWDDERNDFLWVSGLWRALPPDRQWVPGYWGRVAEGAQWTSGYWADAQTSEVEYLPEPPATVEEGPNSAQPSADYIWAPGCWVWNQTRYAWQPGYWAIAHQDWTWVPAHYVWAPRGYVFVNGYYDYSVARRGVLFAPIYFTSALYMQRGYSYSPVTVINPGVFTSHLFLRPSYGHYYFGDYYGSNYSSIGFSPWFSFYSSRSGYDPFYAHQRWHHRNDRQWHQRVEAQFQHRRDHEDARPPRTWTAQRALVASQANSDQKSFVVAAPLSQLANREDGTVRFQAIDQRERQKLAKHGQEFQRFRQERQKLETQAVPSTAELAKQAAPARVKLPRSPILAKSASELGKDHAPPKSHVAPPPDAKIEPRPRVARSSEQPAIAQPATPPTEQPAGRPLLQPRLESAGRKAEPVPLTRAEQRSTKTQTAPKPQPQPRVDQAREKRDARPVQPGLQPQARPRPTSQPNAQAQPRVERPRRQPQAKPQPQPQSRVEQPKAQPQPQVKQPAPQPQPQSKADRPTGPRAGPTKNEPKGKN